MVKIKDEAVGIVNSSPPFFMDYENQTQEVQICLLAEINYIFIIKFVKIQT